MTPEPGRQFGFVASFWRLVREEEAEVMVVSREGREVAERRARSLMEAPERWAMSRNEERDVVTVSGTGAMVEVWH